MLCAVCSHEPRRFASSMPRFAREGRAQQGPKGRDQQGPKGSAQQGPKGRDPQGPKGRAQQRPGCVMWVGTRLPTHQPPLAKGLQMDSKVIICLMFS